MFKKTNKFFDDVSTKFLKIKILKIRKINL